MATVTVLGTPLFDTNTGTKTVTATPAVGDLIVIVSAHTETTPVETVPTDNNSDGLGTYTLVRGTTRSTNCFLQIHVRNSLIGSATSTIFSSAPGTTTGGGLGVLKITGMKHAGSSAVRQSGIQTDGASSGTPTVPMTEAILTGNPVVGLVSNASNTASLTPRGTPAYSEALDLGHNSPTTGLECMYISSDETGSSIAWGGTSASAFSAIVAEFHANWAAVVADSANNLSDDNLGWTGKVQLGWSNPESDSLTLSDALAQLMAGFLVFSDSLTLSDEVVINLVSEATPLTQAVDDTLTLSDESTQLLNHLNEETDTLTLSDAIETFSQCFNEEADSFTLTDEITQTFSHSNEESDSFTLIDEVAIQLLDNIVALTESFSDTLTLSDASDILFNHFNEESDQLVFTDAISTFLVHFNEESDSLSQTDTLETFLTHSFETGDILTLSDSIDFDFNSPDITKIVSDTLILSDNIEISLIVTHFPIEVSDLLSQSDFTEIQLIETILALSTSVSDFLLLTDAILGFYNEGREVSDAFSLSDSVAFEGVAIPLGVTIGDSVSNWNDTLRRAKGSDDSRYYRRYLNDVS